MRSLIALALAKNMYLRTDEESEAVYAMQMAAKFAEGVAADVRLWRWIIIALHNATQGVMVLSLRHGNGLLALSDESYAAWMAAYEKNETPPPEKLDSYLNLYKKVKHIEFGQVGGNKRFLPVGREGGDIRRLNALRNDFIHFTPKGWSLQVDGLPQICLSTARLISFIGLETENVFWHSPEARSQLQSSHSDFVSSMRQLHTLYVQDAS